MKRVKMLAVSTAAVLAMAATVAVSSASAVPTVLCKVKESTCAKANQYEKPFLTLYTQESWGETHVSIVPPGLPSIKCVEEKFTNNYMESSKAGPLVGTMWNVVPVNGCGASCHLEITNSPALELEHSGKKDGNGYLRVIGPIFEASCTSPTAYRCYYTGAKIQLFLEGGEVATAKGGETTLARTVGEGATLNCPTNATVSESLRFVYPSPTVYVTIG